MYIIKIDKLALKNNISQRKMIKDLQIRPGTINELFHGTKKSINIKLLNRLTTYFNCLPSDLFALDSE